MLFICSENLRTRIVWNKTFCCNKKYRELAFWEMNEHWKLTSWDGRNSQVYHYFAAFFLAYIRLTNWPATFFMWNYCCDFIASNSVKFQNVHQSFKVLVFQRWTAVVHKTDDSWIITFLNMRLSTFRPMEGYSISMWFSSAKCIRAGYEWTPTLIKQL